MIRSPLILIEDVINCKQNQILPNWPPLGENFSQLIEKMSMNISSSFKGAYEFELYFSKLEEEVIEALKKKKKEMLNFIDYSSLPITTYTKIA